MKRPIQRIDTYLVPASGSVAESVETYVADRVADIVSDLPVDPVLEVYGTPRGDYVEVMIFTGIPEIKDLLEAKSEDIRQELRAQGIASVFYVKTWTGVP